MKNKVFSAINIFGLALSMSVGMIVLLFLMDILKTDEFNEKKDQIFRITTFNSSQWGTHMFATSPVPLGRSAYENFPGVEKLVEMRKSSGIVEYMNKGINAQGLFAGKDFFNVFSYQLEAGHPATALENPFSIILSRGLAEKVFGYTDCLGKVVKLEGLGEFMISGILDNKMYKSHFLFDYLISFEAYEILRDRGALNMAYSMIFEQGTTEEEKEAALKRAEWTNFYQNYSYLLLDKNVSISKLEQFLNSTAEEHFRDYKNNKVTFFIQPLVDISPAKGEPPANEIGLTLPVFMIWIFVGLSLLVILLAGFNYTNLTIAKSLTRAKEVGIRKVVGSTRIQISLQYILEAVILSTLALIVAIGIVELIIPAIKGIDPGVEQVFNIDLNIKVYLFFFMFSIVVGILAGIFPSLYLSAFNPVKVLKGVVSIQLFAGITLRKILLTVQFTFGIIFIMLTVLLIKQVYKIRNTDLGFKTENRILLPMQGVDPQLLTDAIKDNPMIMNITRTNHLPVVGGWSSAFIRTPEMTDSIKISEYMADPGYIKTMGLSLLSGKNFKPDDRIGGERYVIINQEVVKMVGLGSEFEAVGKTLMIDGRPREVLGVVKDYYTKTPIEPMEPVVLRYIPEWAGELIVEYFPGGKEDVVTFIESNWNDIEHGHPFRYSFIEDDIGLVYKVFGTLLAIVSYVSLLIITIAGMGLLGMVAFTVRNREKEIGIRKVMGASVKKITWILSRDFSIVIIVAMVIAIPAVYLIASQIQMLVPASIGFDPIAAFIGFLILVSLVGLTITSQTIRAARANPVEALRYE